MISDLVKLKELARNPNSALEIGKAAEHIVCANLLLSGYRAYLSDQGLPYDVVVDVDDRLYRIQVKGCCFPRNINPKGVVPIIRYNYTVRRFGKLGRKRREGSECDFVAFVALDIGRVAYMPYAAAPVHLGIHPPDTKDGLVLSRPRRFDEYPFAKALDAFHNGAAAYTQSRRGRLLEIDGRAVTIKEWSLVSAIPVHRILKRLCSGWDPARAVSEKIDVRRRRKVPPGFLRSPELNRKRSLLRKEWWAQKRLQDASSGA